MASKRQTKSVAGSSRLLRPRTPTGLVGKRDAVMKNKVVETEGAAVSEKSKALNKNDKGASSGSTRVLRSKSAKKRGDDAGQLKDVVECAKVETGKKTVHAKKTSAAKGSCSVTTDSTGAESTSRSLTRSAAKRQLVAVEVSATRKNPVRKCRLAAAN